MGIEMIENTPEKTTNRKYTGKRYIAYAGYASTENAKTKLAEQISLIYRFAQDLEMQCVDEALVAGLQVDPRLKSDSDRVIHFIAESRMSRSSYYRFKRRLPKPHTPPPVPSRPAGTLRSVEDGT